METNQKKEPEMNNCQTLSKTAFVNNTTADLRAFHIEEAIINSIKTGADLPKEISDLFTLTIIHVSDGIRGIINWA